eukprot:763989-Hanusia_phi.AAC.2
MQQLQDALRRIFESVADAFVCFDMRGSGRISRKNMRRSLDRLFLNYIDEESVFSAVRRRKQEGSLSSRMRQEETLSFHDFCEQLAWHEVAQAEASLQISLLHRERLLRQSLARASAVHEADKASKAHPTSLSGTQGMEETKAAGGGQDEEKEEEERGLVKIRARKYSANTPIGLLQQRLMSLFSSSVDAFVFLDLNQDGVISREELRKGLLRFLGDDSLLDSLLWTIDCKHRDLLLDPVEFTRSLSWHPIDDLWRALRSSISRKHDISSVVLKALQLQPPPPPADAHAEREGEQETISRAADVSGMKKAFVHQFLPRPPQARATRSFRRMKL